METYRDNGTHRPSPRERQTTLSAHFPILVTDFDRTRDVKRMKRPFWLGIYISRERERGRGNGEGENLRQRHRGLYPSSLKIQWEEEEVERCATEMEILLAALLLEYEENI